MHHWSLGKMCTWLQQVLALSTSWRYTDCRLETNFRYRSKRRVGLFQEQEYQVHTWQCEWNSDGVSKCWTTVKKWTLYSTFITGQNYRMDLLIWTYIHFSMDILQPDLNTVSFLHCLSHSKQAQTLSFSAKQSVFWKTLSTKIEHFQVILS